MERPFQKYDIYGYQHHCTYTCLTCGRRWGQWYLDGYPRPATEAEGRLCPAGHLQNAKDYWDEAGETDIRKLLTKP